MEPIRRMTLRTLVIAAAMLLCGVAARAESAGPAPMVEAFHEDLLAIMKSAKTLGVKGRYDRFLGLTDKYFDMPLMVRFVTGEHWAKAPEQVRNDVTAAARRLSAAELAVLFDSYSGETFKTVGVRDIQDKTMLVDTLLVRQGNDDIKVIYRARKVGGQWRIIDVLLDGAISQLIKRRDEYRRTLTDSGIPGLTKLLNAKADEITAPTSAAK